MGIMVGVRVLVGAWEKWKGKGQGRGVSSAGDNRGLLATTLDEDVEKRRRRRRVSLRFPPPQYPFIPALYQFPWISSSRDPSFCFIGGKKRFFFLKKKKKKKKKKS